MKHLLAILMVLLALSCDGPEPRRPIRVKTGSFIKESAKRNKKLLAMEEKLIREIMAKDSLHTYKASANSSWYYYETKNEESDYLPKTDDVVTLTYNILSLRNDTIYSFSEIDTLVYVVDKQDLFPGLRNSIKLLKEKETALFLFPSSMGFGYHGDNGKIGPNVPLKSTISIITIKKKQDSIQH